MKRRNVRRVLAAALCLLPLLFAQPVFAEETPQSKAEEMVQGLDFTELDELFRSIAQETGEAPAVTFSDLVTSMVNGNLNLNSETVFSKLFSWLLSGVKQLLPLILELFTLSVLSAVILNLKGGLHEQTGEIIRFVMQLIASVVLLQSFLGMVMSVREIVGRMTQALQLVMPVLLTLLFSCGAANTAGVLQPDSVILASLADGLIVKTVLPVLLVMTVLTVVNHLTPRAGLSGAVRLCKTAVSWILGVVFTVFSGITTLRGIAAASYDGVSIRAARYAVNNSVPIIGGMVGESMNMLLSCAVLAKNAVGGAALIAIVLLAASPLLSLIAYQFALRIVAAVTGPLADTRLSALTEQLCSVLNLLFGALCGIAVTVFILICLAIGAGSALL